MCPVKTYELYVNRLHPENNYLWQQAKPNTHWDDEVWFTKEPQSKNKIGGLMTTLTKEAHLSKKYTNHCVRATCVTLLDRSGFEACHIMTVSGHKNIDSIQSYSVTTSDAKKREMSESLTGALIKSPKKIRLDKPVTPVETATKPAVNNEIENSKDPFTMSFRELLELDTEQEKQLINELLNDDMDTYQNEQNKNPVAISNTSNVTSSVNPISMRNIVPKMMFSNCSVTINFNGNN